jgi:hypothetical protein
VVTNPLQKVYPLAATLNTLKCHSYPAVYKALRPEYRYQPLCCICRVCRICDKISRLLWKRKTVFPIGTMAAKKKDRSTLYVRGLPPGLLGRINARAEDLDMERDPFVIELLERVLKRWERTQQKTREWWDNPLEEEDETSST